MPCLLVLLALCLPRVAIVVLFLFTHYLGRAYDTVIWPILGVIFFPFTTLAYAFAINQQGRVSGIYLAIMILAVLADLASLTGGPGTYRRRR